ncbi:MAG: alpha/beta hydrolase [Spirochaetales bacterium]|nr:alpha/beta hydrolase [Spirochaetales bacterium]
MNLGRTFGRILFGIVLVVGLLAVVYLLGPRVSFPEAQDLPSVPQSFSALESYLAQAEALAQPLVPGTEKKILWNNPDDPQRTADVVVYLHGFSASPVEIDPVPQRVARARGANLYYPRLTGHGSIDGEPMGQATAGDWYADGLEALAIARVLGQRVILIGTSTGVTLAAILAHQFPELITAVIGVSPNMGPSDELSWLTAGPWGRQIGSLVMGPTYSWEPYSEQHARYWTSSYPSRAIPELMNLVSYAAGLDYSEVQVPLLQFSSPFDQVVSVRRATEFFEEWGAKEKELVSVPTSSDPGYHVLTGEIRSPENTESFVNKMIEFLGAIP